MLQDAVSIEAHYIRCWSLQSKLLLSVDRLSMQVLDVIHHLDVVETLISDGTSTPEDWAWVKQLRYYITGRAGNPSVLVKMADAALEYSWEYQGNAPKLVYTPLTDRCYLTLTQVTCKDCGYNDVVRKTKVTCCRVVRTPEIEKASGSRLYKQQVLMLSIALCTHLVWP